MGSLRGQSQSTSSPQRRLHPTLPVPAKLDKGTHSNKLLCESPQEQLPVGGIASAVRQKCSRVGPASTVHGFLEPVIFSTQTQQLVEAYLGSEQTQHISENTIFQNGNTGNCKNLSPDRGVGYFNRFQRRFTSTYPSITSPGSTCIFTSRRKSYQFKALPFGLSTAPMELTVVVKETKFLAMKKGIRIHQYLDDWLVRARSHQTCLQHTQTLVSLCQELGWLVNKEKSELESKQVFSFIGYQFDLMEGRVRPTPERWQTLQTKVKELISSPVCPVWKSMSLIRLLTATEKQVHLGRLHMRPAQWLT